MCSECECDDSHSEGVVLVASRHVKWSVMSTLVLGTDDRILLPEKLQNMLSKSTVIDPELLFGY